MYDHPAFHRALDLFRRRGIPSSIPEDLTLLSQWRRERLHSQGHLKIFENTSVLFIQHHLAPFIARIKAMMDDGLKAEHCWYVDIPYSTNGKVCSERVKLGCPDKQVAEPWHEPLEPYKQAQLSRVAELTLELLGSQPETLLVVDDGAYFLRAIDQLRESNNRLMTAFGTAPGQTSLAIVEQTTRGHRHLLEDTHQELMEELECPVVSIARCTTKTKLESAFIGESVSRAVVKAAESYGRYKRDGTLGRVAVIGFGVVGRSTAKALSEYPYEEQIDVIDPQENLSHDIHRLGAKWLKKLPNIKEHHDLYDLVVGCTGYSSFKLYQRALLRDGALLVSGSSGAVEFSRAQYVDRGLDKSFEGLTLLHTLGHGDIHDAIEFGCSEAGANGERRQFRFTLANGGFPANFDGKIESLPPALIQPTHGLLYAASCQALNMLRQRQSGFSVLNEDDDIWLFIEGIREIDDESIWARYV